MKINLVCACAVTCLALGSCSMKNVNMAGLQSALSTSLEALTLTNADIQEYVHQAVEQMDAENQIAPASSAYTTRLNNLVSGITSVGDTPLNFKVYITDQVNAFACADGSVRVYSGIMDVMNDDELLGIIGHEIGHVGMEHSKNAFKQELMNSAMLQAVSSADNRLAALSSSQLAQLGQTLVSANYSRKQESDADDFGYEFLKAAGKNPYGMVTAFEKLQTLEGQSGSNVSGGLANMFSDHPSTAERIQRMTERCVKDGYVR